MNQPIYLDYNATTPVAPEVLEAMLPFLRVHFGNPSSTHPFGRIAAQAVDQARNQVAALIGARAHEIVFTGCATEANNLALLGVARALGGAKRHLVVSAIEHPAVMAPAQHLREEGWNLTVVPVDGFGRVSPDDIAQALRPDTALVSVMHANNEVGTIQPIREIAQITRERGILLHTDAAQSAGKIAVDVGTLGVDLLTLAGHKFYAAKGVGALYIRQNTPVRNISFGADHEHGLRAGTENVPAIVGFGVAAQLARERLPWASSHLRELRDQLHALLIEAIPGLILNGHPDQRLPNTLHVSFPGVSGRRLLDQASPIVAASLGSACHSEHDVVSGVLAAMGVSPARAAGAVRLSVGTFTTPDEVSRAASGLLEAWRTVASL
ncbi:cysteine desulfurase family protein [Rhodoferax ferrireducens]|uniref:cysteine desulfurase family protein n=1 Tax=Rhodoferax ferrireducens TaxID=192843 RepID=UPI00298D941B|nr:cysteine desulfurase family protein [Rhodoferax ferrireducens]WPC67334.1 cysteine desulfurase family protein [Rhodoferax ferrireducens]